MQKLKTLSPYQKIAKIRRFVYIFVIVAGLFNIFFPVIAHADIFNNEVQDLYVKITKNVKETNDILDDAFQLCQTSPYTIMNNALYNSQSGVTGAIHSASVISASRYCSNKNSKKSLSVLAIARTRMNFDVVISPVTNCSSMYLSSLLTRLYTTFVTSRRLASDAILIPLLTTQSS